MKKFGFVLGLLLVSMMLVGWSSAPQPSAIKSSATFGNQSFSMLAASKVPILNINNQTGQVFYITLTALTGSESYWLQVPTGKTKFEVAQNDYTYSYYACGEQREDIVKVKKSGATLKLVCASSGSSGKAPVLNIDNKTGTSFYMTLTGPKTYTINVPTGKSTHIVEQGTYDISYYACSEQKTDSVKIKKKGGTLKLDCAKAKTGKQIAITFNNLSGSNLILSLTGPQSYYLTIPPGKSKVFVTKGTYQYTGWLACGSSSGTVDLTRKLIWTWWCY
jgi:hypothetical protein